MLKYLRRLAAAGLLSIVVSVCPAAALVADASVHIALVRLEGAACGELWVNDALVWRLVLLTDGAKPVSDNGTGARTTLLIPDIVRGMFVVKVE